jgi:hypothetical protein
MRMPTALGVLALAAAAWAPRPAPDARADVAAVLDDFHDAAAQADFDRYFGHFAHDGVFLGTDAGERWSVGAFRTYARPHFDAGRGWTYVPRDRHVTIGADGATAWFDELLDNAKYGTCRGSGVLVHGDGAWRIAQYNLTFVVPNEVAKDVVEVIRAGGE